MASPDKRPTERGATILRRLEERSLSIAEVTRRTPLTKNTILNAIYGPRDPQRKTIEILADVLELPIETLTRPTRPTRSPTPSGAIRGQADLPAPSFWTWLLRLKNP